MKMRKQTVFITAVRVLFLIKLRWPKNKSPYDTSISEPPILKVDHHISDKFFVVVCLLFLYVCTQA